MFFSQQEAEQEAEAACREWQKILRLQDWDVVVRIVGKRELPDGAAAACTFTDENKTALIRLIDPIDVVPDLPFPSDHGIDLVHELLHLHFSEWDNYIRRADRSDVALEQAIVALSKALVWLKRGK